MNGLCIYEVITAEEITRIRKKFKMTQKDLAQFLGISKTTVERWERQTEKITGPVVPLLYLLDSNTELIDSLVPPKNIYPLRIWYMYRQRVCTIIDVDERHRKVRIKNYTDDILFCAFGVNLKPTYEEYEEFLESRCFPKSRDKMKIMLEALEIPYYEPMLIIEKTQGRVAEDEFWLRLEMNYDSIV